MHTTGDAVAVPQSVDIQISAAPSHQDALTLRDMFARSVRSHGDRVALRFKEEGSWKTLSYLQLFKRVRQVAEMLHGLGLQVGDRVAILLPNCPEWPEIYLGITGLGLIAVPMDVKLREQELEFIFRDSGARAIFCNNESLPWLRNRRAQSPELAHVILLNAGAVPSDCISYAQVFAQPPGGDAAYDQARPQSNDVASLIYTSGTTGRPKGAMLTHGNFASNVTAMLEVVDVRADDNFLLVLPLHHAFAFSACLTVPLACGAAISFVESIKTFGDDLCTTAPSALVGVPLLFEKMHRRILDGLRRKPVGWLLFNLGLVGLVRRAVHTRLGGHLRLLVTGGAPCDAELLRSYAHLGFTLLEGYGLTETAPVLTLTPLGHPKPGTVGPVLPGVTLRLFDVTADGIGEVAVQGPNVMRGYYGQPEATAAAFRDGWFLTGDLGRLDAEGYLTITGRKKCLIVNREGKNINPEEVEAQVLKCPLVREALVLGYREPGEHVGEHVGLIVVPTEEALTATTDAEKKIRDDLKRVLHAIADYKHPRRIVIRHEEFEKTSTGKIKRFLYTMPPT